MRPNEIKNTIRAGLFVSILLFMASIITFLIGKESAFLEHKSVIKTEFADVQFLKTGSPVY